MSIEEALTRWTARLALVLYVAAGIIRCRRWDLRLARLAWTAGCLVFLAHVGCAFNFYHHWSHAAALAQTARQTQDLAGFSAPWGLYLNYLFTLVWLADAAWWWCSVDTYTKRGRPIDWTIQSFFTFMFFNGTVVFGSGAGRWLGIAAFALLGLAWCQRLTARKSEPR